jgi:DNA-binding NarL/FixJ family response regulator
MAVTRIVIVDDDVDVCDLLSVMVELDDRFELVGTAETGAEAIEVVRRTVPDAVIVDLDLPEVDGFGVIDAVAALALDIRIVVFSAFPDPFTLLDVLGRGADGYVDKAAAWSELLPTVAALFHDSDATHTQVS